MVACCAASPAARPSAIIARESRLQGRRLNDRFTVRLAHWRDDSAALRAVREAVFIVEQAIPASLEWDDADAACVHALAEDGTGHAVGCARLLRDGSIGRVAVMAPWRGRGVGDALMHVMLDAARAAGHARVTLHAQVQACGFYARLGFAAVGDDYEEAGIAHRTMALSLVPPTGSVALRTGRDAG
jgi:predicted GNAT family N-acyltransferase